MRAELFEQVVEMRQAIRLMSVDNEIFFPIGSRVHDFASNGDIPEFHSHELLDELVVVAGDVDDFGLLAALAKQFLDQHVVFIAPEPAELQFPAINEIADKVKVFAIHDAQEFQQRVHLRVARAEVDIGNPNRAIFLRLRRGGKKFWIGDHKIVRIPIPHAIRRTSRSKARCCRIVTQPSPV